MLSLLRRRPPEPTREELIRAAIPDVDPGFLEIDRVFGGVRIFVRDYAIYKAVRHVLKARIPGDLVECGVLHGRGAALIAASTMGDRSRRLWLYDVFERSFARRPHFWERYLPLDQSAAEVWDAHEGDGNAIPSLEATQRNLARAEWPAENTVIVKGLVQETLPVKRPDRIAFMSLHTDYHDSIKAEMEHLFPLLSPGGVIAIHAYGRYTGAKKATDDYFAAAGVNILLHRIDDSCRVGVKLTNR